MKRNVSVVRLVVKLLKKCRFQYRVGKPVYVFFSKIHEYLLYATKIFLCLQYVKFFQYFAAILVKILLVINSKVNIRIIKPNKGGGGSTLNF